MLDKRSVNCSNYASQKCLVKLNQLYQFLLLPLHFYSFNRKINIMELFLSSASGGPSQAAKGQFKKNVHNKIVTLNEGTLSGYSTNQLVSHRYWAVRYSSTYRITYSFCILAHCVNALACRLLLRLCFGS